MTEMVPINYEMMWKVSQRVTNTPFVPKGLQGKPEAVLACILYGAEMGIGPMQSLNSIHVIEGRAAMSPELMRAMVARHGHRIDVLENSSTACEMKGSRSDTGSTATVRWTMDDAKLAGLAGKNNWKTYPRAMLMARCTSELCRILFPDIIAGLSYTPEEVASIEGVEVDMVDEIPEVTEEPAVEEPVVAEIIDEEDDERRVKIGSAVQDIAKEMVESGVTGNATTPSYEERLRIAETWGGWPLVRAVANATANQIKCDKPISFPELAHNEPLWVRVRWKMEDRNR
jgi:hypothetical protein